MPDRDSEGEEDAAEPEAGQAAKKPKKASGAKARLLRCATQAHHSPVRQGKPAATPAAAEPPRYRSDVYKMLAQHAAAQARPPRMPPPHSHTHSLTPPSPPTR